MRHRHRNGITQGPGALVAAMLMATWAAPAAIAASVQDLTNLNLDQLMGIELPASSQSARFQVSATAVDSCSATATDLVFGKYDPLQTTPTDQTAVVTVTCTMDVAYLIGLDAGIGAGATTTTRRMTSSGTTLNYSLYRDGAHSNVWGNTAGADTASGIGTGVPTDYVVYGRISAKQPVKSGTYQDTITVSVYY